MSLGPMVRKLQLNEFGESSILSKFSSSVLRGKNLPKCKFLMLENKKEKHVFLSFRVLLESYLNSGKQLHFK